MAATPTATQPDAEELFAIGRDRSRRRARGRERNVEFVAGLAFLLVAVAMALFLPNTRSLDPWTLLVLLAAYALTCRAKFDIADGYTAPTELVLVPMLFLLPTPLVPLVVCLGAALGRVPDYITGRTSVYRSLHLFADCWHAVGPALVLVVAGSQGLTWSDWPVYLGALAAQCGFDFVASSARAALIDGTRPRDILPMIAPVYAFDAALAPVGLLVAFAATAHGPGMALLVLPLAGVLAILSRERQNRVDHALELSAAYQGTAMLLGDVVEADDAYTGSHSRGVVELSLAVADRLGLDGRRRRNVEFGALLHDVGKIAVPNEIINKKGPLDDAEWEVMRRHTIEGERMLARIGGVLAEVGRIVRASHEDFDGTGYPDGLAGTAIPVEARIITACDAFSAMTTTRSYREAMGTDAAVAELRRCAGTQFDPEVAAVLVDLIESDR
jgi:HD-GYP domain-containing protein (c-di-GMP phosphodiesterase class II)